MTNSLLFSEIKPFIRYAQRLVVTELSAFKNLTAYDNRFFYCGGGSGVITVDGEAYPMKKGCIIIWRSGHTYSLESAEGSEMLLLGFNFDYTAKNSCLSAPIPPAGADFNPSAVLEQVSFSDAVILNRVIHINNMHLLEEPIKDICREFDARRSFYETKISGLFVSVLTETMRECMLERDNIRRSKGKVNEVLQYIADHHAEELDNITLGRLFGYHPNYINHLVVQHTGMSLHKYLLSYRVNKAIELLQTTDLPVSEISEKVGFSDYNHFHKYFKQATGYTTKAFRVR